MAPRERTLSEARDLLRKEVMTGAGVACPCCNQRVQVYRRSITSQMAHALIVLARKSHEGEPIHVPTALGKTADEAKLRYWGLLEEVDSLLPESGRSGYWTVTLKGRLFVQGATWVPKFALVYDSKLLRVEGPDVGIRDCLKNRFDYDALMSQRFPAVWP